MSPQRVQRKRTKGWRMPENTVYVGRPSKWGNPFTLDAYRAFERDLALTHATDPQARTTLATAFRSVVIQGPDSAYWSLNNCQAVLAICAGLTAGELKGKNLACWCSLSQPCHADVLLELANRESS